MRTMLLFVAVIISSAVFAQDIPASQVPQAVKNALKAKFPKTTGLDWEMKGELYEAEFDVNMVDHKALLDASGKFVIFKRDIRAAKLPQAVRNTIQSQYKDFRIDDAEKLEKEGIIYYQVELDGKPHDQKLVFTADGKIADSQQYW